MGARTMSAFPSYSAQPITSGIPMGGMPMMTGAPISYGAPAYGAPAYGAPATVGSFTMAAPVSYGAPMGAPISFAAPAPAGEIHPEFPHLGPKQDYPTTCTPQDEMLLQKLYAMYGTEEGKDGTGLPGFPYIGAPYIGDYNKDLIGEEPDAEGEYPVEDDEVRGTQV